MNQKRAKKMRNQSINSLLWSPSPQIVETNIKRQEVLEAVSTTIQTSSVPALVSQDVQTLFRGDEKDDEISDEEQV